MRKPSSTNFLNEKDLAENCGMFYTVSILGGRWKVSILAVLLDHGVLRYSEIKALLKGISERMLIKQLKELQADGLVARKDFGEVPPRVEYTLTELGNSAKDLLRSLHEWGKQHKNNVPGT